MSKQTKIEKIYEDIAKTYGEATPEAMNDDIAKLQAEIDKKRIGLDKIPKELTDKREALEDEIKKLESRVNNIEGYSKNKNQIEKIQNYKEKLQDKLNEQIKVKETLKKDLEKSLIKLKGFSDKINNEEYTKKLDNFQYNDLLSKKDELKNKVIDYEQKIKLAEKRITELKVKIGKCDLAWKTLFTNKDWDEIQVRAMSGSKRFTRRVDEKNPPINAKNKEDKSKDKIPTTQIEKEDIDTTISEKVTKIKEKNEENKEKENLPAKVSRWTKFKNWFRDIPNKIKKSFGKEEKEELSTSKERDELKEKPSTSKERDEFLEGLRRYVDKGYRKQVKEEKAKESLELHKPKTKNKEENEKEER